jgi:hypothetical protein
MLVNLSGRTLGLVISKGTRGVEVCSGTGLEVGKLTGSIPDDAAIGIFY